MSPLESVDERLQQAMKLVLLATVPGMLVFFWLYGWGVLINLILAGVTALAVEAAVLRLRKRAAQADLERRQCAGQRDAVGSGLAALLPVVADGLCRGVRDGVRQTPVWRRRQEPVQPGNARFRPGAGDLSPADDPLAVIPWLDLLGGLQQVFGFSLGQTPDAWVQATALDSLRINKSLTMDELFAANPAFGHFGGRGVEWVNLAFLAGGAFLLQRRVFSWHAPVGMLASLFIISLLCWNGSGSDSHGSPLFHLLTGASMLGAFFIVTEPVSGAKSPGARLLFGAGVGLLTYLIRTWGGYPDGVAFAVLLMNLCVPALERFVASRQERGAP